ncbi:MAG: hypothetical protein ABSC92_16140 [Rhizomicrobium sp.]|jgi:hypothetical protein
MPSPQEIADAIDAWFNRNFATGPIARDTDAFNQAFRAKDDLKKRFAALETALTSSKE